MKEMLELEEYAKERYNEDILFILGFSQISLKMLCDKLGINRTSIYKKQGKKEDIYLLRKEIEKEILKLYVKDSAL